MHGSFRLASAATLALALVACGSAAPADGTIRPAGSGWFCHGAEHSAFCARTVVECEALHVDVAVDPGGRACEPHPQAHCFTYTSPAVGEHWRCFDSAQHCESRHGQCTAEESCSACAVWD